MTLIEIMVAIAIFLFVSIAMLTIFSSASNLFNRAESSRQANDEAMAIFSQLEKDLAAAVPPRQGGQFWARCVGSSGRCIVGWTISDATSPSQFSFVVWGQRQGVYDPTLSTTSPTAGTLDDWTLHRSLYQSVTPVDVSTYPSDFEIRQNIQKFGNGFGNSTTTIMRGVAHFGVWLSGTDGVSIPNDALWHHMITPSDTIFKTRPMSEETVATFDDPNKISYPSAVRFTLVTGCGMRHVRRGRILSDNGDTDLKVAGLTDVPILPGTVCIIPYRSPVIYDHDDDNDLTIPTNFSSYVKTPAQTDYRLEIVGIQGRNGSTLAVNDTQATAANVFDVSQGPINIDVDPSHSIYKRGRFVLRSALPLSSYSHPSNDFVFIGTQYSLVRALPVE